MFTESPPCINLCVVMCSFAVLIVKERGGRGREGGRGVTVGEREKKF